MRLRVEDALRAHFRPEFLNRIDETVIFRRLGERASWRRSWTCSSSACARGWPSAGSRSRSREAARELIADEGDDPAFGARPLKRAIQRLVENPLAMRLLEGGATDGSTVVVDAEGDGIAIDVRRAPVPV